MVRFSVGLALAGFVYAGITAILAATHGVADMGTALEFSLQNHGVQQAYPSGAPSIFVTAAAFTGIGGMLGGISEIIRRTFGMEFSQAIDVLNSTGLNLASEAEKFLGIPDLGATFAAHAGSPTVIETAQAALTAVCAFGDAAGVGIVLFGTCALPLHFARDMIKEEGVRQGLRSFGKHIAADISLTFEGSFDIISKKIRGHRSAKFNKISAEPSSPPVQEARVLPFPDRGNQNPDSQPAPQEENGIQSVTPRKEPETISRRVA